MTVNKKRPNILKPSDIADINEMYHEGLNRLKILNISSKSLLEEFMYCYRGLYIGNLDELWTYDRRIFHILEDSGYLSYFELNDQGEEYGATYYLLVGNDKTLWRRERYELKHHWNTISFCAGSSYSAHHGGLKRIHIKPGRQENEWTECACTYSLFEGWKLNG